MEQAFFQSPYLNETLIDKPAIVKVLTDGQEYTIIVRDGRLEIESAFGKSVLVAPQSIGRIFVRSV